MTARPEPTPIAAPPRAASTDALLAVSGVSKSFGSVAALDSVRLTVGHGEVVGLVGDNGAGKSTLIKCISGVGPADSGDMFFDGRPVSVRGPADAAALGIAFVYQDLALCDNLDVAANLFLGNELSGWGPVRALETLQMQARAREVLDSFGVRTLRSLRAEVGSLSGGQRQAIAITRAMIGNPRLLVLDEPTAALGVTQTEQVLSLVQRLKESGRGVIFVSHNLSDVFAVCDRVTVLHLGRNAGDFPALPEHRRDVIAAITGIHDPSDQEVAP